MRVTTMRNYSDGVLLFEEKHLIAILLFLQENGPSRKIDVYEGVSTNPRMPDKIAALEMMNLLIQTRDPCSNGTFVTLTREGSEAASLFRKVDKIVRGEAEAVAN